MFGGTNLKIMTENTGDKWRYVDSAFIVLGRIYIIMLVISILTSVVVFIIAKDKKKPTRCPCEIAREKAAKKQAADKYATQTIKA